MQLLFSFCVNEIFWLFDCHTKHIGWSIMKHATSMRDYLRAKPQRDVDSTISASTTKLVYLGPTAILDTKLSIPNSSWLLIDVSLFPCFAVAHDKRIWLFQPRTLARVSSFAHVNPWRLRPYLFTNSLSSTARLSTTRRYTGVDYLILDIFIRFSRSSSGFTPRLGLRFLFVGFSESWAVCSLNFEDGVSWLFVHNADIGYF
jgi:hypothetical protein